jgi:hypothetical protein
LRCSPIKKAQENILKAVYGLMALDALVVDLKKESQYAEMDFIVVLNAMKILP